MSGNWSWSNNPIWNVPQTLHRKWLDFCAGPAKWCLLAVAAALTAVVAIVPTVREDKRKLPPRDGGKPPFAAV